VIAAEPVVVDRTPQRATSTVVASGRWAHLRRPAVVRLAARGGARALVSLRTRTPSDTPEVVAVLGRRGGWTRVRVPTRGTRTVGWLPRRALGRVRTVTTELRVDRSALRAVLLDHGRPVWSARIGVGRPGTATPAVSTYVRERLVPTDTDGIYGVFAFGLAAYSRTLTDWPGGGQIGIHGTNRPGLLPGRVSHGCVRLRNADVSRLRRLMPLGTPVRIR